MRSNPERPGFKDKDRGAKIQRRMQEQGYNNNYMAEITGLSRQKISRILNGKNRYIDDITLVCRELNLSLDEISGLERRPSREDAFIKKIKALPPPLFAKVEQLIDAILMNDRGKFSYSRRKSD